MSEESKELILITLERLRELQDKELKLESLFYHGIDCWDGYSASVDTYNEWRHSDE